MMIEAINNYLLYIKKYYSDENNKPFRGFSKLDNVIIDAAIEYLLKYKQVEKSLQMTVIRVECNPEEIEKIKKVLETEPFNIRG